MLKTMDEHINQPSPPEKNKKNNKFFWFHEYFMAISLNTSRKKP